MISLYADMFVLCLFVDRIEEVMTDARQRTFDLRSPASG